ncbi:unnamed protein product [Gadus morhua 'NCC']
MMKNLLMETQLLFPGLLLMGLKAQICLQVVLALRPKPTILSPLTPLVQQASWRSGDQFLRSWISWKFLA